MSDYYEAVPYILEHEGGFVNHRNDPGGATNYGISLRWLKKQGDAFDLDDDGDVDIDDIRKMTEGQAIEIYRDHWWRKYNYDRIEHQWLATKTVDMSINMGPRQAHKLVQRGINMILNRDIVVDGFLGPISYSYLNRLPSHTLLSRIRYSQAKFYNDLVTAKPRFKPFLSGWYYRAMF